MLTEISVSCKVLILDGLRQHDHGGRADKLRHCASLRLEELTKAWIRKKGNFQKNPPVPRVKSLASMSFYSRYVRRYLPDYQKCDWNTWERHDNLNLYRNIEWLGPLPNERYFAVRARMWFWSGKWKSKGKRHALLAAFSFAHSSGYFHVPP